MKTKIIVEIDPFDDKLCGHCPMLLTWRFGTEFGCRIFSEEIGGRKTMGLKMSEDGSNIRHDKCIEAVVK